MDDAGLMRATERSAHLLDDEVHLGRRDATAAPRKALTEVLALEELHRDVRTALPDAVVEDLHDVRVPKLSRSLRFALEARVRLGDVGELTLDELHRARRVEPEVHRLPDGSHAAPADHPNQAEAIRHDHIFLEFGHWSARSGER